MKKYSKLTYLVLYSISVVLVWSYTKNLPAKNQKVEGPVSQSASTESAKIMGISVENTDDSSQIVSRVVDGDTIVLGSGETVRYIGIDTPETKDPRKPVQCFGQEAYQKNKELVEGKKIRLEKDVSEKDRYGRLLRYVWVDNIFVNDYLVREGYARVATYPPDVKYQSQLLEAQKEAMNSKKGLWTKCY